MPGIDLVVLAQLGRQSLRVFVAGSVLVLLILWGRRVAGWLGARAFSRGERILIDLGIGFGLLSLVLRLLGAAGLYRTWILWTVALLGALLLAPWRDRPDLRALLPRGGGVAGASLLALALAPLPLALAPAVSWDALAYHLRTPERALVTGRWVADPFNVHTYFPSAHGALYGMTLGADPQGVAAQLLGWGFHAASLLAVWRLAARLGGERSGAGAAALYAAVPAVGVVASWAWADPALVFALAASALAVVGGVAPAGLALLGLAAAVKYTGLVYALPLGIGALLSMRGRKEWGRAAAGALLGAAVAAPWYVANLRATGNPVHPLLPRLFGGSPALAERLSTWNAGRVPSSLPGWLKPFWAPGSVDGDLGGPLLLALLLGGWLVALLRRRTRLPALLLAAAALLLSSVDPTSRVFLPLLAGAAVVGASALVPEGESRWRRRALVSVLLLVAFRGAALVAGHAALFFRPLPSAVGLEPEEEYVRRNFPPAPLYRRAAGLPPASKVLSIGEPRLFRFPAAASAGGWADDLTAVELFFRPGRGAEGDLRHLRSAGFTHLLVTADALRRAHGAGARRIGISGESLDAVLALSPLVDQEGELSLHALPAAGAALPGR